MNFGFDARTRELLRGVWLHGTLSAAAARMGMDGANAGRHLRAAERKLSIPLVERRPGGRGGSNARLTRAGRRHLALRALLGHAAAYDADEGVTPIRVGGRTLFAAGVVPPGPVEVEIRPESVALERRIRSHVVTSVRNRLAVRVKSVIPMASGVFRIGLSAGALAFDSHVVRGALRDLRIRIGSRLEATVKAVGVRASRL